MRPRPIRRRPAGNPESLPDLHPLLRRVFAARNVSSARELDYRLENLLPFEALGGITAAAAPPGCKAGSPGRW